MKNYNNLFPTYEALQKDIIEAIEKKVSLLGGRVDFLADVKDIEEREDVITDLPAMVFVSEDDGYTTYSTTIEMKDGLATYVVWESCYDDFSEILYLDTISINSLLEILRELESIVN